MKEREGTMQAYHLDDFRIGEGVKEEVNMVSQFQHVYEVVMISCGHLHQTHKPLE